MAGQAAAVAGGFVEIKHQPGHRRAPNTPGHRARPGTPSPCRAISLGQSKRQSSPKEVQGTPRRSPFLRERPAQAQLMGRIQ